MSDQEQVVSTNQEPQELKQLRRAVHDGSIELFEAALRRMETISWRKRWPEDILGTVLCSGLADKIKTSMVQALLDGQRPPNPRYSVDNKGNPFWSALDCALDTLSHGALKILHEADFHIHPSEANHFHTNMACQIGNGLWPHPDLITPDILLRKSSINSALFERIFTSESINTATIDRLASLPRNDLVSKRFGRALFRLASQYYTQERQSLLQSDTRLLAVKRLHDLGMLDVDNGRNEIGGRELWQAILKRLEAIGMDQATAKAPMAEKRRGPRL